MQKYKTVTVANWTYIIKVRKNIVCFAIWSLIKYSTYFEWNNEALHKDMFVFK